MTGQSGPPKKRTFAGSRRSPEAEAPVLAITKTTKYRWPPTRADLFLAIHAMERSTFVKVPDTKNLVVDLVQDMTSLWRFWASQPSKAALRGLIAKAQGTSEALGALRDRFMPERIADLRQTILDAAARGEIRAEDAGDKASLRVGYSWFRLPLPKLDREHSIRLVMRQIAGVRS